MHTAGDLPRFIWVDTVLGNRRALVSRAGKAFDIGHGQYRYRDLSAVSYRFSRRFVLFSPTSRLRSEFISAVRVQRVSGSCRKPRSTAAQV
jgi:hypothetical protein